MVYFLTEPAFMANCRRIISAVAPDGARRFEAAV